MPANVGIDLVFIVMPEVYNTLIFAGYNKEFLNSLENQ